MAGSTYSTNLKIELMATGENSGTWGDITNTNMGTALEQAIVGYGNVDYVADANLTISITNSNASQAARALVLNVTSVFGSLTATRELVVPTSQKQYIVQNNTTGGQSITVKTSAGTGITVPNGRKAHLYVDGTNVIQMFDFINVLGGTIDNTTVGATTASSGKFTTLNASGATTLDGTVALGNASGDLITVPGTINSNLLFTDNTYDIGASGATRPRNLFLAGAATIGGNLSVGGTLTLTGGVNLNGNVTVGDNSSDTLTINSTITSNLIFTDNTYDIGASGATRPRNLFLAGNITAGGNQTLTGSLTVDSTTNSTSATTGSIQTDGGIGLAKDLYVGGSTTLGDASADTVTVNGTITSNLLFTDNTYDIGASGATRPRNVYAAGGVVADSGFSVGRAGIVRGVVSFYPSTASTWFYLQNSNGGALTLSSGASPGTVTIANFTDASTILYNNLTFGTDNTYDIGASGATRPRYGYFGSGLVVNGTANNAAPFLTYNVTSANATYNWVSSAFASNLGSGQTLVHFIGQGGANKNSAYLGYYYAGSSGSNSSFLSLGLYGVNHALVINGQGYVGINNTSPTKYLDVGGDILVNGITVGRGGGNSAQNLVVGNNGGTISTGLYNTLIGTNAGNGVTTGNYNTIIGNNAGVTSNPSSGTTIVGGNAGKVVTGRDNTFIGANAGEVMAGGTQNTFVGGYAAGTLTGSGGAMTTGSYNVILGSFSGYSASAPLDIRTASGYAVISDGIGNPRGWWDDSGNFKTNKNAIIVGAQRVATNGNTGNNGGWYTIGTISDWNQSQEILIEIYGTTSYSAGSSIAGIIKILVRLDNSSTPNGCWWAEGQPGISTGTGVVINGSTGVVYANLGNFSQLSVKCTASDSVSFVPTLSYYGASAPSGTAIGSGYSISTSNNNVIFNQYGIGLNTTPTSGTGLAFPATQNASSNANTLDDYEEGSWTPEWGGVISDPTCTYTANTGRYVKIGRMVYLGFRIYTSSFSGGSGNLQIKGLPFTADSAGNLWTGVVGWNQQGSFSNNQNAVNMSIQGSAARAYIHYMNSTGATYDIVIGTGTNGTMLVEASITYQADA